LFINPELDSGFLHQISLVSGALGFLLIRKELLGPQSDPRDELPDRVPSNGIPIIQRLLKVDWLGAFIFVAAFILVLLGMSWGSTQQWNQGKVIVTIVLGCMLLVVFIGWEYYLGQFEITLNVDGSAHPSISPKKAPRLISRTNRMIPLYIFTNFDMVVTSFACVTGGMVMFGCLYFLSIYWNVAAAFRATQSGTQLLYLSPGLGGGLYWSLLLIKHTRQV
jgi:Fungal trichothecene efflux pump (TRI12)